MNFSLDPRAVAICSCPTPRQASALRTSVWCSTMWPHMGTSVASPAALRLSSSARVLRAVDIRRSGRCTTRRM